MNVYKYLNILDPSFLCINMAFVAVDCLNIKKKVFLSKHCM